MHTIPARLYVKQRPDRLVSICGRPLESDRGWLDLFFDYGHDAVSVTRQPMKTPELPGMSGTSIWELRPVSGVWTPETATRVVGIQSAYIHSKYFRAKSWWAVAKVLEQADPALAAAVREKLSEI